MTQKLDSSKKSGEEILQTIEPKGIADESMRRTVEILLNLIEQLQAPCRGIPSHIIQQSKEMHKQEIVTAFDEGQEYEYQYHINNAPKFDSETYYQETFKKD